jgi:nucleotide-binding universal stress UspA family protein
MDRNQAVLVAVDFETASLAALAKAREVAKAMHLEIWLCHVYGMPVFPYPGFDPVLGPDFTQEIANAAEKSLAELAASCGAQKQFLRVGDPAKEVLGVIERSRPSLVAVGTHGRGSLAHFFLGSVAERIVRASPVPVLTVHAPTAES